MRVNTIKWLDAGHQIILKMCGRIRRPESAYLRRENCSDPCSRTAGMLRKLPVESRQAKERTRPKAAGRRERSERPLDAGSGRSHFRLLGWGRTDPSPSRRYQRESAMRRQPDLLPSNRKRVPGEGVVADSPLGLRQGRWKRMNSSLKPGGMVPLSSCSTECLTPAAHPPSGW